MSRRGREAALDEIEAIYRERLAVFRRVGTAVLGDAESARDAVQNGFVRAIRDRASFRGDGPLERWVWRCVMNAARDANRRRGVVRGHAADDGGEERGVLQALPADPAVRALVSRLPERQRLVLFLRYFADLDYATIAEVLGISAGTVAASLHAAHNSLRLALEEVR